MKTNIERLRSLPTQPLNVLQRLTSRRNALLLLRLFGAFVAILAVYSTVFYYLMWSIHP